MDEEIKIISLLDHVMARPSMYVGEPHLDRFQCFITGYTCGCKVEDRHKWHDFNNWVIMKHYRRGHSSLGCCSVIAINAKFGWKKRGMKELQRLWNTYKYKTTSK